MVEDEASQEPIAPESAPASPPVDNLSEAFAEAGAEPSVVVEAPVASLDWSHLRGFQSVEPAPAPAADYAEALHKELAARSARFARSVDDSIVLSSDGLLRWLGDPVARIVSGEQLLQPHAVLLADDALAGEDRTAAETRVSLWLAAHLRKVLAPLFALAEAGELPETAKALGGKIVEALGVLERERVRNDVRALDQSARGALRKLGVRFGALYIYVPLLLKPGARSLCSQLWTLKRGSEAGAERLLAFAAAGRTSFANEGLLSPDSYRVAGFRLCGERVVRVDIIERLSDLIRAAIPDHMRSGSRPTSEAYGFLVTPQMTSLTGCSGEAFASILRSLGFEAVKVAKAAFAAANAKAPTEPIKPAAAEDAPAPAEAEIGETEAVAPDEAATEAEAEAPAVEAEANEAIEAETAPAEASPAEAEAPPVEVEAEPSAAAAPDEAPEAEEASLEAAATEGETAEVAAPEEEIEIWRPAPRRPRAPPHQRPHGGEAREGRPPHGKPHHRRHGRA
ncbi:MAG: helicase, partial [Pseudomonadota bacterium]|nr:helicase [Pseudomonadota bacterium]